jgi:hypothetical protein
MVDRIEIGWPSGSTQTLENVPANQVLTVTETKREVKADRRDP